jgi:hypothetical protein
VKKIDPPGLVPLIEAAVAREWVVWPARTPAVRNGVMTGCAGGRVRRRAEMRASVEPCDPPQITSTNQLVD